MTLQSPKIHIIAVAYMRFPELIVFVQSILNQTSTDWFLTVMHDGPSIEFERIMADYVKQNPGRLEFFCSANRFNDYGHSLRDIGLKNIRGEYVMLTNADNYLIPKAVEYLVSAIHETSADVIIYDMVHSHNNPGMRPLPAYSYFETSYNRGSIDIGAAIVAKKLAETAGFRDRSHDADATYFEDVLAAKNGLNLQVAKIPRVLFVHN